MFLNSPVKVFNAISGSELTSVNNELYENGIRIATQTDIDTLQQEIDNIAPTNPNVWINGAGITTTTGQISFTDTTPNGMITAPEFTFSNSSDPTLTVGAAQISSTNNNMKLETTDYILTTKDIYLQGTEDVQRYLTVGVTNQADNVKTYVDITTADYICDNQLTTKTEWKNASGYYFDNNIYQNDVLIPQRSEIDYLQGEINTANDNISGLNSSVLGLSQRTDALEATTASQQTAIDGLGVSVNANTSSINSLGVTVNSQGTTINSLGVAVNDLNSVTVSQGALINTNTADISSNTIAISGNTTSINTINNKLNSSLYDYYVSAQSGSDLTGDGSIYNPWKTVGKAITVVNTLSADTNVVINLSAGIYTENVSIIKNGVSLSGANAIATTINGNITFNMVQGSSLYSVGLLSNLTCTGTIQHTNSTVYSNTLSISNVISAVPNGINNFIFQTTGLALLGDCTMNNCVVYANADTTPILVNNSALFMVGSQIQNNPSPLIPNTTQNYIYVSAAGRFNAFGCSMYNSSTSASVKALIEVANTSNATSSTTINNCILLFVNGVATATGAIMNFSNTASANTVNFYNNLVRCFCTVNSPNNYFVLKTSTGTVNFTQGNNLGRTGCHTLPNTGAFTGWTKTNFSAVV